MAYKPPVVHQSVKRSVSLTPAQVDGLARQGVFPPDMVSGMQHVGVIERRKYPLRLGNVIAVTAKWLGIKMCESCSVRRLRLNKVVVWGWWRPGFTLGDFSVLALAGAVAGVAVALAWTIF